MPNIEQLRTSDPDLQGLDDQQVVDVVHQAYYPDLPRDQVASALGVKPAPPPEEKTSLTRRAGDLAVSLGRGIVAVPEAAVGLVDMATGGRVGKALEEGVGIPGTDATLRFDPKVAKDMIGGGYSPAQKQANQSFEEAGKDESGFMAQAWEKTKALVRNPSVAVQGVVESLPSMGAGGVVGRAFMRAVPGMKALGAGALGEGIVGAGASAEQIRQQTKDGLLSGDQAALAGGVGAATTLFSMVGAKIAQRLGIDDVDTLLVGAAANPKAEKNIARKVLEGFIAEGALEELPQSISEQVGQNLALGEPIDEDVPAAAVMGFFTGGLMGGGTNAWRHVTAPNTPAKPDITAKNGTVFKADEAGTYRPTPPPAQAPQAVMNAPTQEAAIATALQAAGVPPAAAAAVGITAPAPAGPTAPVTVQAADEDPFSKPIPKPQGNSNATNPPVTGGASSAQPAAAAPAAPSALPGMVGPAPVTASTGQPQAGLVPDGGPQPVPAAEPAGVPAVGAGGAAGAAASLQGAGGPGQRTGAGNPPSGQVDAGSGLADTGSAAGQRSDVTPQQLALKLARAAAAVAEFEAKAKARPDDDGLRLAAADARDLENVVRTQMERARTADALAWERYEAQQQDVSKLDIGARVETPEGAGTILRKFPKNWHVDVDGVGRRTLPPGALTPLPNTSASSAQQAAPIPTGTSASAAPAATKSGETDAQQATPSSTSSTSAAPPTADTGAAPASAPVQPDAAATGADRADAVRAGDAPTADVGDSWDAMTPEQRREVLAKTNAKGKTVERNASRTWAELDPGWRKPLERLLAQEKTDDAGANAGRSGEAEKPAAAATGDGERNNVPDRAEVAGNPVDGNGGQGSLRQSVAEQPRDQETGQFERNERWHGYKIGASPREGRFTVYEELPGRGHQNLAEFILSSTTGKPVSVEHFFESPQTREPVMKAIFRWTEERRKVPDVVAAPAPQKAKRPAKYEAFLDELQAYFQPGAIVKSYAGHDRVIEFKREDERGGWSVQVHAVVQQGDSWVDDQKDNRDRWHSTQPDARELARAKANQAAKEFGERANSPAPKPQADRPSDLQRLNKRLLNLRELRACIGR